VGRDSRPPKIGDYRGRGALDGWLRVVAVHAALNQRRGTGAPGEGNPDNLFRSREDPEILYLKRRYGAELKRALDETLRQLPRRERQILKMHFLGGVSMDAIARMYRVHRTTVVRWIAGARQTILDNTRSHLRDRLCLGEVELDSLMGFAQSRLEVTLGDFLKGMRS
jgi:RNA polymerase sigma-70 factor (ECF subfamily)